MSHDYCDIPGEARSIPGSAVSTIAAHPTQRRSNETTSLEPNNPAPTGVNAAPHHMSG